MAIEFKILEEEEFDAEFYGNDNYLSALGGCSDEGEYGLADWTYQIKVQVTNQYGETKSFTVAYQPEERCDGMKAYSGYDILPASIYGYDADESGEIKEFCNYDNSVLDELHKVAWNAAKSEFNRLIRG